MLKRSALFVFLVGSLHGAEADFNRDVAPFLLRHCIECHSGAAPAGQLDLTTEKGFRRGGKQGTVFDPQKPSESLLLVRVRDGEMPPPKQGKPHVFPKNELEPLQTWLANGAKWPANRTLDLFEKTLPHRAGRDWWSLQPIQEPTAKAPSVDHYVQTALAKRGWKAAPRTDKRTLIRRVYFDLLGYPPTFEQVEAFVTNNAADAYPKLIDQLLASPHYGERWGRHWLDVVRYAETCGYERDQVKNQIWKYRDWVIQAFHADMPFDRFIREQLAGDEIDQPTEQSLIATGFIRLGTWNDEPNDPNEYKYDRLEDMVGAATSAFLGLTVKCARCHDHKFDAIRQTDYYRIAGAFWAGYIEPGPREHLGGPDPKKFPHEVHAWTDRGRTVPPIKLLKKGDPTRPGDEVVPRGLSTIPALDQPFQEPAVTAKTTQRRLQLAHWIADPKNPLTARVWANRVWHWHFGQGLVRSVDNFGFTGDLPTHPELLDWLAKELLTHGWSTKHLHRLILLSETYQQSSIHPQQLAYAQEDAGNKNLWRFNRQRLDAESLRDAMLFVAGQLQLEKIGGPSFAPVLAADALEGLSMKGAAWQASPPAEQGRRSVYIFSKRGLLSPQLTTFDLPDTTLPCGQRDVTIVPTQALTLLNNAFAHAQSEAIAKRVLANGNEQATVIKSLWRMVLARDPRPSEAQFAADFLNARAREQTDARSRERAIALLAHVLLNTNELAFVD